MCAWCGCDVYSDQVRLTRHTRQAVCKWHTMEENYERPGPRNPSEQQVPKVQKIPEEDYDDVTVQSVPSIDDIIPSNSNG